MAAVGAVMDAAIGWLVQSILGNLFTEKLEAWTRRVGLANDVQKLRSDMRYVQMVVAAAKGRKIDNEPLALSLADLKELLYDAEDVMDDLDYYRLKEQVESGNTRGGTTAACNAETSSTLSSSSIQQFGSTLFRNLGSSKGKRKREDDQNIAACAHLNQSEFSQRIKTIGGKLRDLARDVTDALKIDGSNLPVTSNLIQSARQTSSYLVERKVFGRNAEVESILQLIASSRSNDIAVLPIVGMGGVGKTTLAQLVYNDPMVKSQFQTRIWVCVSDNFDVLRLTKEMLSCVSKQRPPETDNLDTLQKDLEKNIQCGRFLIVLDDVWDDMNEHSWNKLLAPLKHNQATGNLMLLTTRKLSIVQKTQTVESVKLDALADDDFWLLFRSCAFGDEKDDEHPSLSTVGKLIAQQLRGNPLAAKTVGALLRRNISIDNWTAILGNEEWKALKESGGIMPALKLSYDYLPDYLQQCFRYCCLFPKDYHFDGLKVVRMWISQGFVHGNHTGKKLEDIGNVYLADLVNSGFFQVGRGWNYSNHFVMHDLMHDLACEVSRTDFATIDGMKCKEIWPTTRHLSIFTGYSALYYKDAFSHEVLTRNLLQVTSVRKLRSLVLIGDYGASFFTFFHNIFKEAENLRLLCISATNANFDYFISSLVNCTHIRYIQGIGAQTTFLTQDLTIFPHLEVLDVNPHADLSLPSGMTNLVSLKHLVGAEEVLSSIASIGNMTALQELPVFKVQDASGFHIRQLKSMNNLVRLGIYQLENVKSKQEATEARLIDKGNLEDLSLLWNSDSTNLGTSTETTNDVFEGLKPHQSLKYLKITGYIGSTSPSWFSTDLSVTSLQQLHLENCKEWRVLPPLEKLPFLRKLKLINICVAQEVRIPCLEELVLTELPCLEKCIATCMRELDFHLRVLIIENCHELKVFTPFKSTIAVKEVSSAEAKEKRWLSGLRELRIHGCPRLMLSHPVPPAPNTRVSIEGLSAHPTMKKCSDHLSVMSSNESRVLDAKILAFQNLKDVTSVHIEDCPNLVSLSIEGLMQLNELRKLNIIRCGNLVPSCIMPNSVSEDWKATSYPALPRFRQLQIESCGGIAGKWLTEMLPHIQPLKELNIVDSPQLKSISIHCHKQEAEGCSLASSSECQAVLSTSLTEDKFLLRIPSNVLSTLKTFRITIWDSPEMELCGTPEGFDLFPRLERLIVDALPALAAPFCRHLTSLPYLELGRCVNAVRFTEEQEEAIRLLTSLQELRFFYCSDLVDLPTVLHDLSSLKRLVLYGCRHISRLPEKGLPPSLEELELNFCSAELQEECRPLATQKLKVRIAVPPV